MDILILLILASLVLLFGGLLIAAIVMIAKRIAKASEPLPKTPMDFERWNQKHREK